MALDHYIFQQNCTNVKNIQNKFIRSFILQIYFILSNIAKVMTRLTMVLKGIHNNLESAAK